MLLLFYKYHRYVLYTLDVNFPSKKIYRKRWVSHGRDSSSKAGRDGSGQIYTSKNLQMKLLDFIPKASGSFGSSFLSFSFFFQEGEYGVEWITKLVKAREIQRYLWDSIDRICHWLTILTGLGNGETRGQNLREGCYNRTPGSGDEKMKLS